MPFGFLTNLFKKRDKRTHQDVRDTQSVVHADATKQEALIDTSQFGMFILEDKLSDLAKAVDVVTIHGLNGHYLDTWTTTNAAGLKSIAGIGTFAEQLLEDLRFWRVTQAERNRPIVFICHSLGGIIVKQALVRAHERDRFSSLLAHVYGIAFFGTPHRGADLASWATMMGNRLSAAIFGASTNTKFVKELKSRSEVLDNISKSFVEREKGLKILSFYETDKMDNLNCLASHCAHSQKDEILTRDKVVEKQSATLDLPNEATIALNGTHRTICKFTSENEQRCRTVWSNLQEMITTVIIDETLSEAETACLTSLYISCYEGHRDRIERPVAGTCTWILKHPKYKEWLQAETASMLWVSADPGCGKSVLTSFLVDAQTLDNSRANICYFFFKDDNDEQKRSNFAIAAILHQIYTSQPCLIKHALKWHKAKGTSLSTDFPNLWKLFIETVEDERARDIICLIDALHECQTASCEEFMATLDSAKRRRRDRLNKQRCCNVSAMLVQANIDQLKDAGFPNGLLANLQKQLIEGADRTFLWVTLIIRLLKDASVSGASQNQLDAIIRSRDIDEVCNRLFQRSAAPLKAKSMLQIVLAAASPLCLDELSVATALNWKHKILKELEGDLIHPFDNYIRTLCGNFLRIVQGKVYLVHQTAREFLLKPHPSKTSKSIADTLPPDLESESKYEKPTLERLLDPVFPSLFKIIDGEDENFNFQELIDAHISEEFRIKVVDKVKMILAEVKVTDEHHFAVVDIRETLVKVKTEEDENQFLEELQRNLDEARAESAKRKFLKVTTEFKKSQKN